MSVLSSTTMDQQARLQLSRAELRRLVSLWLGIVLGLLLVVFGIVGLISHLIVSGGCGVSTAAGRKVSVGVPLYKDPSQPVNARVVDLLGRMTLDEKIGQMTQIERSVSDGATLINNGIGSVVSGAGSTPGDKATVAQWVDMTDSFQKSALSTRLGIPEIYGIDAMHGHHNVWGATIFPHNVGLGCTRDPALLERIGTATALEVRATGIPWVFQPSVAVCRDPRWGNCFQSFSEDPEVVRSLTTIIDGMQGVAPVGWDGPYVQNGQKVAACAQMFVGDGGTVNGTDAGNTVIDLEGLNNIHMKGYVEAIKKGVSSIMVSFSSWNGVKMHANKFLLTDVLKGQMGFKGLLLSAWFGVDRIEDGRGALAPQGPGYLNSVQLAINAGIDMVMVPYLYAPFISDMKTLVTQGKIPMSRIDDAVTRILRVKFQTGLYEAPFADKSLEASVGAAVHRVLAREAVRKSLVLLKNGKAVGQPLLPLSKNVPKVLVVGAHANDIGLQCGGWTITWQGMAGSITPGTTILQGIQKAVSSSTQVVFDPAPKPGSAKGMGYSYAIVVVGEPPYTEFMGDNLNNLALPAAQQQMITDVCADVACVVVMISGRPLVAQPWLSLVDAFVAAWLPGSEAGSGIADVLFGDFEFQGTLARTWFKSVDQLPMNFGDQRYDPLFSFGFGLKMGGVRGQ
ncbi:hypothetical protein M758_10G122900 [Ceratodon purpureus]|uniref:beta-glucosidase n=1 Tax=Ceratodon purpureus TaxID=3225 RepID=A0A8T0GJQ8_CERPU|nr:hypothetical protein KC19_10G127800 [Ceratodon purpureus]KAG0603820.1 hypothetical protein M758_10G122900 [Ceratodon purpureus]